MAEVALQHDAPGVVRKQRPWHRSHRQDLRTEAPQSGERGGIEYFACMGMHGHAWACRRSRAAWYISCGGSSVHSTAV